MSPRFSTPFGLVLRSIVSLGLVLDLLGQQLPVQIAAAAGAASPLLQATPTSTATEPSSATPLPSQAATPEIAPTPSGTDAATSTATLELVEPTASSTESASETATPTQSDTSTPSDTLTATATVTETETVTLTPTETGTATAVAIRTDAVQPGRNTNAITTTTSSVSSDVLKLIPTGYVTVTASPGEPDKNNPDLILESAVISADKGSAAIFLGGRLTIIAEPGTFGEDVSLEVAAQPLTIEVDSSVPNPVEVALDSTQLDLSDTVDASQAITDVVASPTPTPEVKLDLSDPHLVDEGRWTQVPFPALGNPEQATIRVEITARGVKSNADYAEFKQSLNLVFDLRGLKGIGADQGNFVIAYRDDKDPNEWHRVSTTVHSTEGLISTVADHFTPWAAYQEPGAWHYNWTPATVSTFSGAATYSYLSGLTTSRT